MNMAPSVLFEREGLVALLLFILLIVCLCDERPSFARRKKQSRRGESQKGRFPPEPPLALLELVERLLCLAALVEESCLNFR